MVASERALHEKVDQEQNLFELVLILEICEGTEEMKEKVFFHPNTVVLDFWRSDAAWR